MRAVITAGGRIDGEYSATAGTSVKALARVRGSTMLERAVSAARDAGARAIAVVGGDEVRCACRTTVELVVAAADDGAENVARALGAWQDDEQLLYLTSDLPYIDGNAVAQFVGRAGKALAMPVTGYAEFARRFPNAPAFGIRIGRDRFVNGGAFVIPAGTVTRVAELGARFFRARKQPWSMARLAGVDLLIRFSLGLLSIAVVERRAQQVLGIPVQAVRDSAPELAYDADDVAEYRYALAHA